jgi:hypothetical protein
MRSPPSLLSTRGGARVAIRGRRRVEPDAGRHRARLRSGHAGPDAGAPRPRFQLRHARLFTGGSLRIEQRRRLVARLRVAAQRGLQR